MRIDQKLVTALVATAACTALVVPTSAFASRHGGGDDAAPTAPTTGEATTAPTPGAPGEAEVGEEAEDRHGGGSTSSAVAVAVADHVKARLSAFDTATVTWRAGGKGVPAARYVVHVTTRGADLTVAVGGAVRTAEVPGLDASTRYTASVTGFAADGTTAASSRTEPVKTLSHDAAVASTRDAARQAAKAAKKAQRLAEKAAKHAAHARGRDRDPARAAARRAHAKAEHAVAEAHDAAEEAGRARHEAAEHESED